MTWSVIYTVGQSEFLVRDWLEDRGIECYVPFGQSLIKMRRKKNLVPVIKPAFPCYGFVKHPINFILMGTAPGFRRLLKAGGVVLMVNDSLIDGLRLLQQEGKFDSMMTEAKLIFKIGDEVLIVGGLLEGKRGVVKEPSRKADKAVRLEVDGLAVKIPVNMLSTAVKK